MCMKFGTEEWTFGLLLRAKFHPHRCNDKGIEHSKLKILLKFDQTSEYKRHAGGYSFSDFREIFSVCTALQDALTDKIGWICSRLNEVMGILS